MSIGKIKIQIYLCFCMFCCFCVFKFISFIILRVCDLRSFILLGFSISCWYRVRILYMFLEEMKKLVNSLNNSWGK